MKKKATALIVLIVMGILFAPLVSAHGVSISYTADATYKVVAVYDDGTPMADAQVRIYSPEDAQEPYEVTSCDENGVYYFTPDTDITGDWYLQFSLAGHGGDVTIPVGEGTTEGGDLPVTIPQMIIMGACFVWGCIGTFLFFKRR
jgi:nickel transport protein